MDVEIHSASPRAVAPSFGGASESNLYRSSGSHCCEKKDTSHIGHVAALFGGGGGGGPLGWAASYLRSAFQWAISIRAAAGSRSSRMPLAASAVYSSVTSVTNEGIPCHVLNTP